MDTFQESGASEGQSKQVLVCFGFFQTLIVIQQTWIELVLHRPIEGDMGTMPVTSKVYSLIGKDDVMVSMFLCPPHPYVEALITNGTVRGNKAFKEVIKVK